MTKLSARALATTAILIAPQTLQPGQMTPARVWVQNRGRAESIPVDLRESNLDTPLRVRVVTVDGADSATAPLAVRSSRLIWEYRTVTIAADDDVAAILNGQGTAGWETTGVAFATPVGTTLVLKRPR